AFGVAKLLDSLEQSKIAFLDQVKEAHAAPSILLGDRHHQPQVGLHEVLASGCAVVQDSLPVVLKLGFYAQEEFGKLFVVGPFALVKCFLQKLREHGGGEEGHADVIQHVLWSAAFSHAELANECGIEIVGMRY